MHKTQKIVYVSTNWTKQDAKIPAELCVTLHVYSLP
jgi:hypothetical protein